MKQQVDNTLKILLVDDHSMFREGMRAILETEPDFEIVGEAGNGREALEQVARLKPQVVVMDVQMPILDGIKATRAIKKTHPEVIVIVLTVNRDEMFLIGAIRAGAAGYILKESTSELLVQSVRTAAQGGNVVPIEMLEKAMREPSEGAGAPELPSSVERLTPRETEVLRLIARGYANQALAEEIGVSIGTVKKHVQNIMAKLQVSDRTQAALWAVRVGLAD